MLLRFCFPGGDKSVHDMFRSSELDWWLSERANELPVRTEELWFVCTNFKGAKVNDLMGSVSLCWWLKHSTPDLGRQTINGNRWKLRCCGWSRRYSVEVHVANQGRTWPTRLAFGHRWYLTRPKVELFCWNARLEGLKFTLDGKMREKRGGDTLPRSSCSTFFELSPRVPHGGFKGAFTKPLKLGWLKLLQRNHQWLILKFWSGIFQGILLHFIYGPLLRHFIQALRLTGSTWRQEWLSVSSSLSDFQNSNGAWKQNMSPNGNVLLFSFVIFKTCRLCWRNCGSSHAIWSMFFFPLKRSKIKGDGSPMHRNHWCICPFCSNVGSCKNLGCHYSNTPCKGKGMKVAMEGTGDISNHLVNSV